MTHVAEALLDHQGKERKNANNRFTVFLFEAVTVLLLGCELSFPGGRESVWLACNPLQSGLAFAAGCLVLLSSCICVPTYKYVTLLYSSPGIVTQTD